MIRAGLRVLSAALLTLAGLAVTSCGDAPAAPSRAAATTGFEGSWTGSTADGSSIAFTVSSDQRVVAITVGYAFNGCRGTRSFDHLDIRLAPGRSPLTGL